MKVVVALVLVVIALAQMAHVAGAQIEPPVQYEIKGSTKIVVNETGIALVGEEIKFSAVAFKQFRQMYNPLSTFVREITPRNMPQQIEDLKIDLDEANNRLTATYKVLGMAEYLGGGKWVLRLGDPKQLTLSTQNGNTFVFTNTYAAGAGVKIIETITVELPEAAKNPAYLEDEGAITYQLPLDTGGQVSLRYLGMGLAAAGAAIIGLSLLQSRRTGAGEGT